MERETKLVQIKVGLKFFTSFYTNLRFSWLLFRTGITLRYLMKLRCKLLK